MHHDIPNLVKSTSRAKYRRLLLLYSLVIIIPGTFLGILAYRGIHGNILAEIKIQDDRLARMYKYYVGSIEDSIDSYRDAFRSRQILRDGPFITPKPKSKAEQFTNDSIILQVAYWEPDSMVKLLYKHTYFLPDDYWDEASTIADPVSSLSQAYRYESAHERQPALEIYSQLAHQASDQNLEVQALIAQNRLLDSSNHEIINEQYQKLHKALQDSTLDAKPDSVALYLINQINQSASKDTSSVTQMTSGRKWLLDQLAFLVVPQSFMTESQHWAIYSRLKTHYESIKSIPDFKHYAVTTDSLIDIREEKIFITQIFNDKLDRITQNLQKKNTRNRRIQLPNLNYCETEMCVLISTELNRNYNVAVMLNTKSLLKRHAPVLEETTGFPKPIAWCIVDEQSQVLLADSNYQPRNVTFDRSPIELGNWTLHLHEENSSRYSMIQETNQQAYLFGFVFVIAVMAIGLFLTIRSLTAEYRLSQLKSDFVSTVSHEFKSPLTSLRMMSERLANQKVAKEDRKQEYYNRMLAQSERLSHLVENILDFSRIDDGRKSYHFEPCNLVKLSTDVISYLTQRHHERGFDIEFDCEEEILFAMVDAQGIHQVIYNLIDNAIKYSGDARKIKVELSNDNGFANIRVQDFGIGISKKDQKRIFTRFYRSERVHTARVQGSGIGLSIVSEIVKAHKGKVMLSSEIGKGSVFTIYLPVNQNQS